MNFNPAPRTLAAMQCYGTRWEIVAVAASGARVRLGWSAKTTRRVLEAQGCPALLAWAAEHAGVTEADLGAPVTYSRATGLTLANGKLALRFGRTEREVASDMGTSYEPFPAVPGVNDPYIDPVTGEDVATFE